MRKNILKLIIGITALFVADFSYAQTASNSNTFLDKNLDNITFYLIITGMLIVVLSVLGLSYMLLNMAKSMYREVLIEKGLLKEDIDEQSWEEKIVHSLTQAVPVENEKPIELDHEYDGIRELDNRLPPWWVGMFYACIIWSVIYMFYYHISGNGKLQIEEYNEEMAIAELQKEEYLKKAADKVNESSVTTLTADADLAKGKQIYTAYCVACHGGAGEGGVGPNLTDKYWIHGGGIKNIFKTVKYGVPEKGMIAWQTQLKPGEMQQVSSYIMTLQGTNPPNGKEPQGTEYLEEHNMEATKTDTTKVAAN
jgi:cytochrome c oxidase cbb3-type subunit III